jgi:hypothetical protein
MHIIQSPLFDFEAFIATKGNDRLVMVRIPVKSAACPPKSATL